MIIRFERVTADLQRLTEGGEYAVSFTPMSEIIRDAEAQGKAT